MRWNERNNTEFGKKVSSFQFEQREVYLQDTRRPEIVRQKVTICGTAIEEKNASHTKRLDCL